MPVASSFYCIKSQLWQSWSVRIQSCISDLQQFDYHEFTFDVQNVSAVGNQVSNKRSFFKSQLKAIVLRPDKQILARLYYFIISLSHV